VRIAPKLRRRLALLATGLLATVVLASSCSLDAAVATDPSGYVVRVQALELRSSVLDLALALALEGHELVVQLRWRTVPTDAWDRPVTWRR
jgi:hypothetical protein